MEIGHRYILRNKRMLICKSINGQLVIDHLKLLNVLTKSDIETLNVCQSNLKRNEKLLDVLPKRGAKAFAAFEEALRLNKLSHLLDENYKEGDPPHDKCKNNAVNNKMEDERGVKENKGNGGGVGRNSFDRTDGPPSDVTYDEVPAPRNGSYDVADPPMGQLSAGASKHPVRNDYDVVPDVGGKQVKIDEYDIVDTPPPPAAPRDEKRSNGYSRVKDPTHERSVPMSLNTDRTDFPGLDATDAPPSSASSECEDGPFNRLGYQRAGNNTSSQPMDIVQSPVEFTNCYQMTTDPRGHFLIINNKNFLPESTMQDYPRNGTDLDANAMVDLFEELGYLVHSYRNQTCFQMRSAVKKFLALDHSKSCAAACCFLSHGKEGILYGTDGEIEIRELTSLFGTEKGLAGKPKMFFFQACQGSDYMDGIVPDCVRAGVKDGVDGPGGNYGNDISLPTEADFIYSYSTVPGYYSWRNSARGSWFIQGIVDIFRRYAHKMDVIRMLTRVNEMVSSKKSATGQRVSHDKRQIASIITQLRYELYLVPPHGPLKEYRPAR